MKTSLYNLVCEGKRFNSVQAATEHYNLGSTTLHNSIKRSKDKDSKTFKITVKGLTFIIINLVKTNHLI